MNLIGKLFFGVIATILLVAFWTAGDPPPISFFWQTKMVVIVGHFTDDWDTGFGVVKRTTPLVASLITDPDKIDARLMIEDTIESRNKIIDEWAIGSQVKVRIHPDRSLAYPTSIFPFMTVPTFGLTTVLFFLVASQVHGYFRPSKTKVIQGRTVKSYGGAKWIIALFLLIFTVVPSGIFIFGLNFGEPPPKSIWWPRAQYEVVSSAARIFNVGNGTQAAYVDVYVRAPGQFNAERTLLKGITYSSVSISRAREMAKTDYPVGRRITGMTSPGGELFVSRLRFTDGFVLITGLIMLLSFRAVRFLWKLVF